MLLGDPGDVSATAGTPGTRPTWCLLTDPVVASTLPRVASGLKGFLRARGVAPSEIDDYVQEALRKAVAKRVTYTTPDELLAWCLTVSRNMVVDESRRLARRRHLMLVDEPIGDAEAEVLSRFGAQEVLAALRQLPEADLEALTTRVVPQDRRESNRLAQRRTRARIRLSNLLGGAVAACWLSVRQVSRSGTAGMVAASCVAITIANSVSPAPERQPLIVSPSVQVRDVVAGATARSEAQPVNRVPAVTRRAPRHPTSQPAAVRRLVVEPRGTDQGVYVDERDRTPDDRLVCADNVPLIGRVCTPN